MMTSTAIVVVLGSALCVYALVHFYKRERDGQWRMYPRSLPRRLIDGTEAGGDLMRRYVNGTWVYRRATSEESQEHHDGYTW